MSDHTPVYTRRPGATLRNMPPNPPPTEQQAGAQDRSWEARFGRVLLGSGLVTVPRALFTHQGVVGLTAQDVWFVARVLVSARDGSLPNPSLKGIAAEAGMSVQGIRRIRDALVERALLVVHSAYDPATGVQLPNSYDFSPLFARLEDAIVADPPRAGMIEDDALLGGAPEPRVVDNSFVARFGRVISRAGVAPIPAALFTYQGALDLSVPQLWFVMQILSYKWSAALPYPSLKKLAVRTSYSDRNLHKIKDELVQRGHLEVIARELPDGGRTSSAYDFSGLFDLLIALLANPAGRGNDNSDGRGNSSSEGEQRGFVEGGATGVHRGGNTVSQEGQREFIEGVTAVPRVGVTTVQRGSNNNSRGRGNNSSRGRGNRSSYKEGTFEEDRSEEGGSNRITPIVSRETHDEGASYSPYIAAVADDYSVELGNSGSRAANVAQALRLWRESGLSEEEFVAVLHGARRVVREYQGKQGNGVIANKAAYYFRVVEGLLQALNTRDEIDITQISREGYAAPVGGPARVER